VNLVGCLLIGLAFALGVERNVLSPALRVFLVTGFLGALTTFSTFAMENVGFARDGLAMTTLLNLLAHNVGGLVLVVVGIWIGRLL
jgi:CrcB protein